MLEDNKKRMDRALRIAGAGGYQYVDGIDNEAIDYEIKSTRIIYSYIDFNGDKHPLQEASIFGTIFDSEFARALWPENDKPKLIAARAGTPLRAARPEYTQKLPRPRKGTWQYHLQNMVIVDEKLKYLDENIVDR